MPGAGTAGGGETGTRDPDPEAAAWGAAIEEILTEFPGYGYLRVAKPRQRAGWEVNHQRIYRVMGGAAWRQRQPRERRVRTTESDPGLPVYPNLLADCGWRRMARPEEAWGADLTHVRLGEEFCSQVPMRVSRVETTVAHTRPRKRPLQDAVQALSGGVVHVRVYADEGLVGEGSVSFGRARGAVRTIQVLVEEELA